MIYTISNYLIVRMKLNILILSSYDKFYSGNLVLDRISALESAGHNVTWGYDGIDEQIEYIKKNRKADQEKRRKYKYMYGIKSKIEKYFLGVKKWHYFDVNNECNPKLLSPLKVDKIRGDYDLIYVFFTSFMISADTISKLYEKFRCPIVVAGIDMYHITGGCIFTGDCENYSLECKKCPSLNFFNKHQAHQNFKYKQNIYKKCDVIYTCNTWQKMAVDKSMMFDPDHVVLTSYMLDETFFIPKDNKVCKSDLGIKNEYSLVFLARYEADKRKGFHYLVTALNNIYSILPLSERRKVLLLTVGGYCDTLEKEVPIPIIQLGRISVDKLVTAYNAANLFISPSVDDTGPSMVNQAMACGTPVLTFKIGTALDVVKEGKSGFAAELGSQEDFTTKLKCFIGLSDYNKQIMREHARSIAMKYNSRQSFIDRIVYIYKTFSTP